MTEADLKELLRQRHDGGRSDEWIFLTNVGDATGYKGKRRFADAVAMNLWPSRSFGLHGFEIKLSRADFMAEMRDPEKASAIKRYCDYWWLVIPDKEIIRLGGVPDDWGVMCAMRRGGLRAIKKAPKLDPEPVSREFLASLLRNAGK